jgi:hypothetical protein
MKALSDAEYELLAMELYNSNGERVERRGGPETRRFYLQLARTADRWLVARRFIKKPIRRSPHLTERPKKV